MLVGLLVPEAGYYPIEYMGHMDFIPAAESAAQ